MGAFQVASHNPLAADEHLVVSPVVLGNGENLLAGIDLASMGYKCTEHASSPAAMHVVLTK